jgi:streptogramin lyase
MKSVLSGLVALVITAFSSPSPAATLTEWQPPFLYSLPTCLSVDNQHVYYMNFSTGPILGRLDADKGIVTEWFIPFEAASPGDVLARKSDHTVFVTDTLNGRLGQFNPETGDFRIWDLPEPSEFGPMSLDLDSNGRVLFSSSTNTDAFMGRLDTGTNVIETWQLPPLTEFWAVADIAGANDESVFFSAFSDSRSVGRVDFKTGEFTSWPLSREAFGGIDVDHWGHVYFQQMLGNEFLITRLIPSTGHMTNWNVPEEFFQSMIVSADLPVFASWMTPGITVLNPLFPGEEIEVEGATYGPLSKRTDIVSPTIISRIESRRHKAKSSQRSVNAETSGPFVTWPTPGTSPSSVASDRVGTVYFAQYAEPGVIGRLSP